ncbi:hypothetical protein [Reichenbachiella sp.]|uniref:hypothetical protein n=1 Tax=Reichenbachiella sp. TaxID=2184521 RepID=UPI003BAFB2AD
MKVNGNHKNGKSLDSQKSKTDQISQKAVAVVDEVPVSHFNPVKTWEKLSEKLGKMDKGLVTWGLAMAASFSLLVAANIKVFDLNPFNLNIEDYTISEMPKSSPETIVNKPKPTIHISGLKMAKPIKQDTELKKPVITSEVNKKLPKTVVLLEKNEQESIEVSRLSNPFVSVFGKANFQSGSVVPEIGVDFKIAENYTAKRRQIYKIGMSSQLNFKTNESGDKRVYPHTFVNLEFTSLNKKTNKGWTSRAGYLLNPDGQLYQDTTIKVSLFRNISKHIKLGPEVIFTNNMKQAYPSISLILG